MHPKHLKLHDTTLYFIPAQFYYTEVFYVASPAINTWEQTYKIEHFVTKHNEP